MDAAYWENKSAPGVFNPAAPERSAHVYRETKPFSSEQTFFNIKLWEDYAHREQCSAFKLATDRLTRVGAGRCIDADRRQREQ